MRENSSDPHMLPLGIRRLANSLTAQSGMRKVVAFANYIDRSTAVQNVPSNSRPTAKPTAAGPAPKMR